MEACFPCLGARKRSVTPPPVEATAGDPHHRRNNVAVAARTFSFEELAAASSGFNAAHRVTGKEPCLYKGYLKSVNQVVAMKREGNGEFLARVQMLNALRHPNLVNFIGFCADGSHWILVHEYMPSTSLEDRLHDPSSDKARLDWSTRMNVAAGVARALEYLHTKGVVYRYLRSADILLGGGGGYHPKLSQYGLAKVDQVLDDELVEARDFARIAGAVAPETVVTGHMSSASDVYTFGVVLLEMITGRRPCSSGAADADRILVTWARPLLEDRAEFRRMADPALEGRNTLMDLEEALWIASMCIHEDPRMRSPIGAVVRALARLAYDGPS